MEFLAQRCRLEDFGFRAPPPYDSEEAACGIQNTGPANTDRGKCVHEPARRSDGEDTCRIACNACEKAAEADVHTVRKVPTLDARQHDVGYRTSEASNLHPTCRVISARGREGGVVHPTIMLIDLLRILIQTPRLCPDCWVSGSPTCLYRRSSSRHRSASCRLRNRRDLAERFPGAHRNGGVTRQSPASPTPIIVRTRKMTYSQPSALRGIAARKARTDVELIWIEKRLEHWIRFGRIAAEQIVSRKTRIVSFRPNAVFALVRWSANDFGTVHSRIDILRAVMPGEPHTTAPFVRPGGELCLSVKGWPKVQQVLTAIDAVEAVGLDPCDVAPDHWRHVHNRLTVGDTPRAYTIERHQAWLKRRALGQ